MDTFADADDTNRRLSDLGLIGFWECDFKAGRIKVSPQLARFYGMTCHDVDDGECDTSAFVANVVPDDQSWTERWRPLGVDSTGIATLQYRVQDEAGRVRWVLCRGRYALDAEGRLASGHGMIFDVTASKEEGTFALSPDEVARQPIDHIADLLLEAFSVAKKLGDETVTDSISMALMKTAALLARLQARHRPGPARH